MWYANKWLLGGLSSVMVISIGLFLYHDYQRKLRKLRKRMNRSHVNIGIQYSFYRSALDLLLILGAIFGIDVGGSLTKIVYFETHPPMISTSNHHSISNLHKDNMTDTTHHDEASKISQMKRSKSLERLHTPDYQQALQELYSYMNEPQTFHNKQGLRDDALSFYSDVLGGRIHFLHFQTRHMSSTVYYQSLISFVYVIILEIYRCNSTP